MARLTPGANIPFRYIAGLPREAQIQIQRDFEELARVIAVGSVTLYDCYVDGSLTTSLPGNHAYKNIGDAVTNETAKIATGHLMIGVVTSSAIITETADISVAASLVIEAVGRPKPNGVTGQVFPEWDLAGHAFNVTGATLTRIRGLELFSSNTFTARPKFVTGGQPVFLQDCFIPSSAQFATSVQSVCDGILIAQNCTFDSITFASSAYLFACQYAHQFTANTTLNTVDLVWIGGTFTTVNGTGGVTLTLGGTSRRIVIEGVEYEPGTIFGGSVSSATPTFSISNTGSTRIRMVSGGNVPNILVTAAAGPCSIEGQFNNLTIQGNSQPTDRKVVASVSGVSDITGPCVADITILPGASTIWRGAGLRGTVGGESTTASGSPAVSCLSATDAVIIVGLARNVSVGKPYTIDAPSSRCLLVFPGSTGWAVAGVNSSASSLVITELGAPPTGAAGGSLAGSFPNPIFAGRDSSVDAINKDLLPGALGDVVAAPVVYPPSTGGSSSPTGAAGGSLGGTYPNPIFSGRDTSVDDLNKDMTQGFLVLGGGVVGS